ncbi:MAG: family 10 glycosylhydrolase [Pseudomonadota bacterium]
MYDALVALALATLPGSSLIGFDAEPTPGWHRGGLELQPGRPREIKLDAPLTTNAGALAFWILPKSAGTGPDGSFALLSASWDANSYLAISQGWWEPIGSGQFYVVLSNRDAAFCNTERSLATGRWTQVVVTWNGGAAGYCRIYFDGVQVGNSPIHIEHPLTLASPMTVGSDGGSRDRRSRDARGVFDELQSFPASLNDVQVRALYERAVPDPRERQRRAFDWARPFAPERATAPAHETRALLDESWQWARSREDVANLVDTAARAGFNVLVPCAWHGRGTVWPTERAHVQSELVSTLARFDPLAELIARAHRAGIEVHPWITVVRREDERYPQFFDAATPAGAYDVQRPEFRAFMTSLVDELATHYDIDGVNLDYIRAMGICRSDSCARAYRQFTGQITGASAGRNLEADIAASGVAGPARESLTRWQDAAVRDLVTTIGARVRAARPGSRITVSGHPVPLATLRPLEGRAEVEWLRHGLIDAVLAMEYGAVPRHERMAAVAAELPDPAQLVWVFANFERLDGVAVARPAESLGEYIRFARARIPGSGVAIYLRAMLNDAQRAALAGGAFRQSADPAWAHLEHSP